jgi:alcohol dehydrogenase
VTSFDFRTRTRIVFGLGEFTRLGEIAREHSPNRCLLLADQAMVDAGYAQEAVRSLKARRMEVFAFHEFGANPTVDMVEAARQYAAPHGIDLLVGLGGGSTLDLTKAVNVVLTNGGSIRDYWGYGNAHKPLLPMVAVPTSAGTGSEAQSNAAITDPQAGATLTCGDAKLIFRTVLLDPRLTLTQPAALTASAGFDAISHAIETMTSTRRTPLSECFSNEAWRLLDANYARVLRMPEDLESRAAMLLASHLAGLAVEQSSLGPAHACAQPLVRNFTLAHGVAVALVLTSTLEWLEERTSLVPRLRQLAAAAGLPATLQDAGIPEHALPRLAEEASAQWSGRFGSRSLDADSALEIYRAAFDRS